MKIRISGAANQDLLDGFYFYEKQDNGLGPYFLDSLFSDIDSLILYAGVHPVFHEYYRMLSRRFPFAVYYRMTDAARYMSMQSSIAGEIPHGQSID